MAIKITKGSLNIVRELRFSPVEAEHLRVRAELMLALELASECASRPSAEHA